MTPENCPLCGNNNYCGNLSSKDNKHCWCMGSEISFPNGLLTQVSATDRHKACICKVCVLRYKSDLPNPHK